MKKFALKLAVLCSLFSMAAAFSVQTASASQISIEDESSYDGYYDDYAYRQPSVYNARVGSRRVAGISHPNMTVYLEVSSIYGSGDSYTLEVKSDSQGYFLFNLSESLECGTFLKLYVSQNGIQVSDTAYLFVLN